MQVETFRRNVSTDTTFLKYNLRVSAVIHVSLLQNIQNPVIFSLQAPNI
jgi:hypothetical protein